MISYIHAVERVILVCFSQSKRTSLINLVSVCSTLLLLRLEAIYYVHGLMRTCCHCTECYENKIRFIFLFTKLIISDTKAFHFTSHNFVPDCRCETRLSVAAQEEDFRELLSVFLIG